MPLTLLPITGTWTPAFSFATPGNLSVSYSLQYGSYTKISKLVIVHWALIATSFTHTTASGAFQITGLPFTAAALAVNWPAGTVSGEGWTLAGVGNLQALVTQGGTTIIIQASRSGTTRATLTTAEVPTGGFPNFSGVSIYQV